MQNKPKTGRKQYSIIKTCLLAGLILASGLVIARSQPAFSLSDQVIINTQRLVDLERRMRQLEEGGSIVANQTSSRLALNDALDGRQQDEINQIKNFLAAISFFTVSNLIGLVLFLLKDRLFGGPPSRPHRRD